jgi:starch synthase (maltosyl-transferring)
MKPLGNDRWRGEFPVAKLGPYQYSVKGWIDRFRIWRSGLLKRVNAVQDVHVELLIGVHLVEEPAQLASGEDAVRLHQWACTLGEVKDLESAMTAAVEEELGSLVQSYADRNLASRCEKDLAVVVEREKARLSISYGLFPRSCSPQPERQGTLRGCAARLPSMGFDIVYLPPIHPIGHTFRKGKRHDASQDAGRRLADVCKPAAALWLNVWPSQQKASVHGQRFWPVVGMEPRRGSEIGTL